MLSRLQVRGYKALRDLTVAFEPLTVIVGPNGCGKTSVLEAIERVRNSAVGDRATPHGPESELRSKGAETELPFLIELRARVDGNDKKLIREKWREIQAETNKPADIQCDEILVRQLGIDDIALLDPSPDSFRSSRLLETYFRPIRRLQFDAGVLSRPSYLPESEPKIRDDGAGLSTVISWLQGERDERFAHIEEGLRRFVPEIRRIRTRRVPIQRIESADVKIGEDDEGHDVFAKRSYQREEIGHQVVIDYEHAQGVPAPHASEGTLLLLGLLTAIHTNDTSVLLLDDIERGLHPKSQQQLVVYLQHMAKGGTQIIATSHSPYLLLHLEHEQVRAMTLAGAAGSRIGELSQHPEFERWKAEMNPSEFWTVFGEDWLRGRKSDA